MEVANGCIPLQYVHAYGFCRRGYYLCTVDIVDGFRLPVFVPMRPAVSTRRRTLTCTALD